MFQILNQLKEVIAKSSGQIKNNLTGLDFTDKIRPFAEALSLAKTKKQQSPTPTPSPQRDIAELIGKHETKFLQNSKGNYYQPKSAEETYSYQQPFSGALGRYQVEPPTLKDYSKMYLGRQINPKEFLGSSQLQDQFIRNRLADWKKRFNLTEDQVIKAWNVGLNGDFESEKANKYLANVLGK